MKKNKVLNILLLFTLSISTALFVGCGSDNKEVFVEGDTTELKAEINAAYALIADANPAEYKPETVEKLQEKVDIINSVVNGTQPVSAQEVINMQIHLQQAVIGFLNDKMIGIPEENLLAGWSFDEGTGTTLTGEGTRGLVATLKPGPSEIFPTATLPQFVDDGINKAILLKNGAHLEIEQYNPNDFLGKNLSIAVWVKTETVKGGNYIASLNYWNNWKFQIQEQAKALFTVKTQAGITDSDNERDLSVNKGAWHHVVVVLQLDSVQPLKFYVDGLLSKEWDNKAKPNLVGSQGAQYVSPLNIQLPLMIGAATTYAEAKAAWDWSGWDTPTSWDFFDGMMDEIKFYNTNLLSGQVQWLYNKEIQNLKQ